MAMCVHEETSGYPVTPVDVPGTKNVNSVGLYPWTPVERLGPGPRTNQVVLSQVLGPVG